MYHYPSETNFSKYVSLIENCCLVRKSVSVFTAVVLTFLILSFLSVAEGVLGAILYLDGFVLTGVIPIASVLRIGVLFYWFLTSRSAKFDNRAYRATDICCCFSCLIFLSAFTILGYGFLRPEIGSQSSPIMVLIGILAGDCIFCVIYGVHIAFLLQQRNREWNQTDGSHRTLTAV